MASRRHHARRAGEPVRRAASRLTRRRPTLHGPWTKQPFALSTDPTWGETHLWAPHIVFHDARYWMYYCAGGAREVRVPHPPRHLDRLHDLDATSREPDGGRRLRSARPDGAVGRRPVGHVLHRDERAERRRARGRRDRVRRPRALDRPAHRVPRRDDGHGRRADRVAVRVRARRSIPLAHRARIGKASCARTSRPGATTALRYRRTRVIAEQRPAALRPR